MNCSVLVGLDKPLSLASCLTPGRKPKTPAGRTKIEAIEKCVVSCTRCGCRPQVEFDPAVSKLEAACPECGFRIHFIGYMCDSSVYEVWNREARDFKRRSV